MKARHMQRLLGLSIATNLLLIAVFVAIVCMSGAIRLQLHEGFASRFGKTEIAFIGDSLTREGGVWERRLHRPLLSVRNLGHSALYVEQLEYQARIAVASGANSAFVMGGTNDAQRDHASVVDTYEHYIEVLAILNDGGVHPIIQSTLHRADGKHAEFVEDLNALLAKHAREHGYGFINLNARLAPDGILKDAYSRDGVHLTRAGYDAWADRLEVFLREN